MKIREGQQVCLRKGETEMQRETPELNINPVDLVDFACGKPASIRCMVCGGPPFASNVKDNRRHRQPMSECSGPRQPHYIVYSRQYFTFSLLLLPLGWVGRRHRVLSAGINCVIRYIIRSHASRPDMGWPSPPYIHGSVVHFSSEYPFVSYQLNCRGVSTIFWGYSEDGTYWC